MTRAQDGWSFTMKPYEIKTLRIVNEKVRGLRRRKL